MEVLLLLAMLIGVLATIFWIWMLVECVMKEPSQGNDKLIWALIIIFIQGLGAVIYFFFRRPIRIRQYGR